MLMYPRREKLKQAKDGDTEDRMSNLHDAILTRILSFLSTKEAVKTGTLSKRWKYVWASVPTLHLSETDFLLETDGLRDVSIKARFLNFVDRVLMDQSVPSLEKVAINGLCHDPSHIESWICAAVERNVRELRLVFCDVYEKPPRELPRSLFSCNTLVVLKLGLNMVLNFPVTSTCLRNLKVLHLIFVIYKDDNSLQNLISSCPVLEDLSIMRYDCANLRTLNITSRTLKDLCVVFSAGSEQSHLQTIVIDASALESIDIDDSVTQEFVVGDLSFVVKAKLHVSNFFYAFAQSGNYAISLLQLLGRMSNIRFLSLLSDTMLSLWFANSYNLPKFHNLTCLELCDSTNIDDVSWKLMMKFLNSSPVLEVLIFEGFLFSWTEEFETSQRDVPNCLLSHLKIIKITKLVWKLHDVKKVRYFLKNAKVLEKMTVTFGNQQDQDLKLKVIEKLQMLPRGSKACRIEIC